LKRFGGRTKNIILIAGGADKKLVFNEWAAAVKKRCKQAHLLSGDASIKQKKALAGFKKLDAGHNGLGALVKKVSLEAVKGDIVLFSPAAASFNLWPHEFARGDDFIKAVKMGT